jgi:hypothetical protein
LVRGALAGEKTVTLGFLRVLARPFNSRRRLGVFIVAATAAVAAWMDAHTPPLPHLDRRPEISDASLRERVEYLASPGLRGRMPLLRGSSMARRFILDDFAGFGLRPWGTATELTEAFALGTNIVGVLPGADPRLRDEVVLVSAHYDHIGGGYPGAADNAAGVAAMLEILERLAQAPERPLRSVCFAAFDCEELGLLGAFTFASRPDVASAHIAAVVNLDTLGRRFSDGDVDALVVSGTERYPALQEHLQEKADGEGLRFWPLGNDLVCFLGDQFAFQDREGIPVLFFTNGFCSDYHGKGDTAARIDYGLLRRTTEVAAATVEGLANEEIGAPSVEQPEAYRKEAVALNEALGVVLRSNLRAAPGSKVRPKIEQLSALVARRAAGDTFDEKARETLLNEAADTAGPELIGVFSPAGEENADRLFAESPHPQLTMKVMLSSLLHHSMAYSLSFRSMTDKVMRQNLLRLALLGVPEKQYVAFHACEHEVAITPEKDGQERVDALVARIWVKSDIGPFGTVGNLMPYTEYFPCHFHGTADEAIDYFMLAWRGRTGLTFESTPVGSVLGYHRSWSRVLTKVAGAAHGERFKEWLAWRKSVQGISDDKQWFAKQIRSRNSDVVKMALTALFDEECPRPEDFAALACAALRNRELNGYTRYLAMRHCRRIGGEQCLCAIAEVVNDATPRSSSVEYLGDPSYAFYNHPYIQFCRMEGDVRTDPEKTLGRAAQDMLKDITKQDFGGDVEAWKACVQRMARP